MSSVNLEQARAIAEESADGGLIRRLADEIEKLRGVLGKLLED